MTLIGSIYNSLVNPRANDRSVSFLSHNNTPVNNYCSIIPIIQPSLISTGFGQSVITLNILVLYLALYLQFGDANAKRGVEFRLLTSLIIGNVIITLLTFNDWFNLTYSIIFCNDYKNGLSNLYQVSELIETYKLHNLIEFHWKFAKKLVSTYSVLVYKQFIGFFIDGTKEAFQTIQSFLK